VAVPCSGSVARFVVLDTGFCGAVCRGRYETPVAGAAVNLLDGVVAAKTGINADVSRQQHSTAHAYSVADAKLPAGVRQSNV